MTPFDLTGDEARLLAGLAREDANARRGASGNAVAARAATLHHLADRLSSHGPTDDGHDDDAAPDRTLPERPTRLVEKHAGRDRRVLRLLAFLDDSGSPGTPGRGYLIPRVAEEIEVAADEVVGRIDDCPELLTALQRLIEARDWLVRAYFAPAPGDW